MDDSAILLAKSFDYNKFAEAPAFARLVPHLKAVERAGNTIVDCLGKTILEHLSLTSPIWKTRLSAAVRMACLCHDLGKANDGFQKMVRGIIPPAKQPLRHELLSALMLLDLEGPVRHWVLNQLRELLDEQDLDPMLHCIVGAVGGHHIKLDEEWERAAIAYKGGCGAEIQILLSHPDLTALFREKCPTISERISLIQGNENYFGSRHLQFKIHSRKWQSWLGDNQEWLRLAAAVKALTIAADVAGSALLPERQNISAWVAVCLSNRLEVKALEQVVKSRLKDCAPRAFQREIAETPGRVTLVEAGCGSGKTISAYLWAQKRAIDKKLFFCYPTTGTATEGFLGYVHQSDVEAELFHSRAAVDLEWVAQVRDEDEQEELLRIESLSLWKPQAIICTADTVLGLVRNSRRALYNSPSILSASFVFDELHAYDNSMLAAVIALIQNLPGANFLLMTASLPPSKKKFLLKEVPDIAEVSAPADLELLPRYLFNTPIPLDEAKAIVRNGLANRQRVLWICNTVRRAQELYDEFKKEIGAEQIETYHSRYKYVDRVERHRSVVDSFSTSAEHGALAITTQVAEMSLDLNAQILISEIAPIPALIQRLGRLNRRTTVERPEIPRPAFFIAPKRCAPYDQEEVIEAITWLNVLCKRNAALSQRDLVDAFHFISREQQLQLDVRTAWLNSGWCAMPEPIRDAGCSVSVLLEEDLESCQSNRSEIARREIPMPYQKHMDTWRKFRGRLIAPGDSLSYCSLKGAFEGRRAMVQ